MSGGHFEYQDHYTAEMFEGQWQDEEINELFSDLFVSGFGPRNGGLVKSLDFAICSDTSMESYREDVKKFKDKWFNRTREDSLKFYQDKLQEHCDKLKKEMGE